MFERFTDQARRVVVLAQEEARMLGHGYIGTEHLLLGILHEGENAGASALASLGISLNAMRQAIEDIVGRGEQPAAESHIPFTPRGKKVLELSLRESLQLGVGYIGPEHILLALFREGSGVAPQVLVRAGVDLNRARQQVIELGLVPPELDVAAPPPAPAGSPGASGPAVAADLVARLASFAARLDAIERRLSQSG
jgi:ATP-dependent Clp protease ATP-binding subunit ClpC